MENNLGPPLRPLSVQPEANKFFKAFLYLGDVIVACRLNKKIKKLSVKNAVKCLLVSALFARWRLLL